MPTDVLTLPSGSLNTKWKEPYASASLNQKLVGVVAAGIYRGLRLRPDPSLGDRTIQVQKDPDKLDHVAVYENANGYAVTYRDSTSGDIILSLTAYSSVNVVVCIFIDYQIGVSTTGKFRVFTEAEFNALTAAVRNALVILGTVTVPASGVIPSANISLLRRTLASTNLSRGTILNAPLVRNPGFESGETNATYAKSSLFWDKSMTVGTGTWKTSTTQVATGMKSIELNVTAGPVTGDLSQQVGAETAEDELFLISVAIKQLKTISSGSLVFFLEWSDVNDALLSTTTVTLDGGGIDSSFRTVETIIPAPAGAGSLRSIGVRATSLSPSSTGIFGYIDNVDVFVESRNPQYPYAFDQAFRRTLTSTSLALYNQSGTFADAISSIRFDPSTPSGEGRVLVEPGNAASLPPTLELLGRLYRLGSGLLASEVNALRPRVEAQYGVVAGIDYTLMWESAPASGSVAVARWYVSPTGAPIWTQNAKWGSPTANQWNKDVSGVAAMKLDVSSSDFRWQVRGATVGGSWLDSAWGTQQTVRPISNTTLAVPNFGPVFEVEDSSSNRRVIVDHNGFRAGRTWGLDAPPWTSGTASPYYGGNATGTGITPDLVPYRPGSYEASMQGIRMQVNVGVGTSNLNGVSNTIFVASTGPARIADDCLVMVEWESYGNMNGASDCYTRQGIWNTNGAWFEKEASVNNNWFFRTRSSLTGLTTSTDTGIPFTVVGGGNMHFRVEMYGANRPGGARCLGYINGVLEAEHTTDLPDVDLGLHFSVRRDAGTGILRYIVVSPITVRVARVASDFQL